MERPAIDRPNLRLEQRRHEERVLSEFDCLNPRIIGPRSDREPVSGEMIDIRRRQAEVTPMKTREGCTAAERMHPSSWNRRHGALLRNETAGQPIDYERPLLRSRLGVVGVSQTCHIPSELNHCVLKPGTCSKEWLP